MSAPTPAAQELPRTDVWVVVAAYNEAPRLGATLRTLTSQWPNVVVVDDGSSDGTGAEALKHPVWLLRHEVNGGQGLALVTGITFSLERGAKAIITFDGDGQHDVNDLDRLLEPLRRGVADVALGSRFLERKPEGMPASRRLLLWAALHFTRLTSGLELTDTHNGLRALSRSAAQRIKLVSSRMAHASELLDQIGHHRLRYVEVPVTIRYSAETLAKGQSSWAAVRIVAQLVVERLIR